MYKPSHKSLPVRRDQERLVILVADDHFANRLLTQSLLVREGHHVILAQNGREAIHHCQFQVFDLILLDIQMPVLDGFEALKKIRATPSKNKTTPIYALTAYSDYGDIQKIYQRGFEAVLIKPFKISEMMRFYDKTCSEDKHPHSFLAQNRSNPYQDLMDLSVLETRTLDILLDAIGQERMCRVLTAYWKDAESMIGDLKAFKTRRKTVVSRTLVDLRKIAHGLKGTSANIGLLRAAHLSARLQNAPPHDIDFLIEILGQTLEESAPVIQKHCGLTGHPKRPEPAHQMASPGIDRAI